MQFALGIRLLRDINKANLLYSIDVLKGYVTVDGDSISNAVSKIKPLVKGIVVVDGR